MVIIPIFSNISVLYYYPKRTLYSFQVKGPASRFHGANYTAVTTDEEKRSLRNYGDISIWRADKASSVSAYSSNFIHTKSDKVLYLHTKELVFPGILNWSLVKTLFFSLVILAHVRENNVQKKKKRCVLLFARYLSPTGIHTILECI